MDETPRDRGRPAAGEQREPGDERRDAPARDTERDDERRRERKWRIGAAQMAAPSTRRWRRAGGSDSQR